MKKQQDKQAYPLIKRLFGRKQPPAQGVYAGPEYFKKEQDPAPMEDVYAGPEFYERDPEEGNGKRPRTEPPMKCVYAGPVPTPRRPIPPKDMNIDPPKPPVQPMECVYAGPEYWDTARPQPRPVPAPDLDPDTIPEVLEEEEPNEGDLT